MPIGRRIARAISWLGPALVVGLGASVSAQQAAPDPAPAASIPDADFQKQFEETQKLIEQMQQRLDRINRTAGERERELEVLDSKVGEAVEHIDGGHGEGAAPAVGKTLETDADIARLVGDGSGTVDQLRERLATLGALLTVERRTVGLLKSERDALAARLDEDADKRTVGEQSIAALEREKAAAAGREAHIRELEADGGRLKSTLETALAEVDRLGRAARDKDAELARRGTRVADLEDRLNKAASAGGGELRSYRAELIGRLRSRLGEQPGIRIDGDYLILQADLLFGPGMAETRLLAGDVVRQIAAEVREVTRGIPSHVAWIVRVDGHTDNRPPPASGGGAAAFASDWQLAAARAMAVADALSLEGVPAQRLGVMSFAGNQPLDARDDEIAQRRNRRIEIRLTQR